MLAQPTSRTPFPLPRGRQPNRLAPKNQRQGYKNGPVARPHKSPYLRLRLNQPQLGSLTRRRLDGVEREGGEEIALAGLNASLKSKTLDTLSSLRPGDTPKNVDFVQLAASPELLACLLADSASKGGSARHTWAQLSSLDKPFAYASSLTSIKVAHRIVCS